jgi:hypothetical protein
MYARVVFGFCNHCFYSTYRHYQAVAVGFGIVAGQRRPKAVLALIAHLPENRVPTVTCAREGTFQDHAEG